MYYNDYNIIFEEREEHIKTFLYIYSIFGKIGCA